MFGDLAHTLQHSWQSIHDLQSIAIAGKLGKSPGISKPFENLRVAQIKELHARGEHTKKKKKRKFYKTNWTTSFEEFRVPTMLLLNPQQSLSQLNLHNYTILDCEPLHDIKGHFLNLFSQLLYLLKGEDCIVCEQVIAANRGSTMTGAKCYTSYINQSPTKSFCLWKQLSEYLSFCTCMILVAIHKIFYSFTTVSGYTMNRMQQASLHIS